MKRFAAFSTDELLAEIVRRRNERVSRRPIVKCEECQCFKPAGDKLSEKSLDTYNPCTKGHKMNFRVPDENPGANDDWGYFLRCCADRAPA